MPCSIKNLLSLILPLPVCFSDPKPLLKECVDPSPKIFFSLSLCRGDKLCTSFSIYFYHSLLFMEVYKFYFQLI